MKATSPLNVWLVTTGEPLPLDEGGVRLLRHGIVAGMMAKRGWQVTWWTSNFDHTTKVVRHVDNRPVTQTVMPGYRLMLLPSRGYEKNVSWARIADHRDIAASFSQFADTEPVPDVILCSYPTIELADAATRYGASYGVPVVLDVRDLWPDIFIELAPRDLQWLARCLLWPYKRQGEKALQRANALIAITEPIVDWACARAGRTRRPVDKAFALACPEPQPLAAQALQDAALRWRQRGVDQVRFVVCFFGALGRQFDFETVLRAVTLLEQQCPQALIVVCGQGQALQHLQAEAAKRSNLVVPGWLGQADLQSLMHISAIGLAPYINEYSFTLSVPNKIIEYLSGGLPVLSCLKGQAQALLQANDCGLHYQEHDPKSLCDGVVQLFGDAPLRARLQRNGLHLYQTRFTADKVYGDMLDHLAAVADTGVAHS